jgi:hypothetical protein
MMRRIVVAAFAGAVLVGLGGPALADDPIITGGQTVVCVKDNAGQGLCVWVPVGR